MPRLIPRLLLVLTAFAGHNAANAQDSTTYGEAFSVPVFESVDQNGVDLITGSLRITTPVMEIGSENNKHYLGLQWTGKGWTVIGRPTIWRDGDKYIVNHAGRSEEFNNWEKKYTQRKPVNGSSLNCVAWSTGLTSECVYTDRNGDVVHFKGIHSPLNPAPFHYGAASAGFGNIGIAEAVIYSVDRGIKRFGYASPQFLSPESGYYNVQFVLTLGDQTLTVTTPNNDDADKHYLRPRNTTQTVTDSFGSIWRYTVNDNRRLTRVVSPDGASVSITYNDGKVASVTNASGTWTYSYTSPGDYGTTTAGNPLGEETYVKYHRERGYVTEARDPLNRWTFYSYDAGHRPTRITYPEGNYVEFAYDPRGNVTSRTTVPKPSAGGPILVERAGFDLTCTDIVICNQPRWSEDARGARTDYDYAPSTATTLPQYSDPNQSWPMRSGTNKPITVTSPAVGGVRPQVRTTYSSGMPLRTSSCITQASCAGTSDEVVTTFEWGGSEGSYRHLFGKAVTAQGQTLRTCYGYDTYGRVISETPPIAGLASCPLGYTPPPPVTASMPVQGTYAVAPTFPDGSTGSGGGTPGPVEPLEPECGWGGVICP
ncbi:MAG TPA: hypothetical protein VGB70_02220 [Allosphingosinicella sp.]